MRTSGTPADAACGARAVNGFIWTRRSSRRARPPAPRLVTQCACHSLIRPHVTIGVARETYLNNVLAEPFKAFTFSVTGAAVYQLGGFGSARKELEALSLTP
jgi:hypothetical protein